MLLVRPDASPPNWWQGVLGVVCVVAALALGMFVRARRQLALAERERAASEQELRVAQARQMERNRIAREMHDVLAHRLSLLSLQAGALEQWPGRTAYRIVQEGLTNARKHAEHAKVSVAVRGAAADGLTVEIRNPWPNGVAPTTPIPGAGMGIIGLAERAALTGGRLEHGRTPAGEFRLWTWLPWPT
jgi:signal transduction histidine kinase